MAKTVRKLKRIKEKEQYKPKVSFKDEEPPAIVVTPPDIIRHHALPNVEEEMKVTPSRTSIDSKITSTKIDESNGLCVNTDVNNTASIQPGAIASTSQSNLSLRTHHNTMANINVSKLIAELSENSKASKEEMEYIQRKLLHQANEILKVNAFANSHTTDPNILDNNKKYNSFGKIPIIIPGNNNLSKILGPKLSNSNLGNQQDLRNHNNVDNENIPSSSSASKSNNDVAQSSMRDDNSTVDTQLVPEKLQRTAEIPRLFPVDNSGTMINSGQGNMQRVAMMAMAAGRSVFFSGTGSSTGCTTNSPRAALHGGECLEFVI